MVSDMSQLRTKVFERTGIAVDEHDPIMAVLAVSAEQTEQIGRQLLARVSVTRAVVASSVAALVFAGTCSFATWQVAQTRASAERAEWLRQQANPRLAELLRSPEGKAGLRLAELGVASLLMKCNGRPSWRVVNEYCVPATTDGRPDGFRVGGAK